MLNIGEFARLGQVSPRMLRHYDQLGLLVPERVDSDNGYRSYGVQQLGRLHRLLALRDLGFSLEQVGDLLDDGLDVEQLRGMLRLRHAELEQTVSEEQGRLRRVEAHLRAIEGSNTMETNDVVIKDTHPLRVVEAREVAAGFGSEHIGPIFMRIVPKLTAHLADAEAQPGMLVGYYDDPADDGSVGVHVGLAVGEQAVGAGDGIRVVDLPVIRVASVVHRGGMEGITDVYAGLIRWIEDSGQRMAGFSRELYHEVTAEGPSVTELQVPIA
jgi:DNA-binding transcriptional MerR regulator